MPTGKHGDQDFVERSTLADDSPADFRAQPDRSGDQ
jgi:hypothetical protein